MTNNSEIFTLYHLSTVNSRENKWTLSAVSTSNFLPSKKKANNLGEWEPVGEAFKINLIGIFTRTEYFRWFWSYTLVCLKLGVDFLLKNWEFRVWAKQAFSKKLGILRFGQTGLSKSFFWLWRLYKGCHKFLNIDAVPNYPTT